MTANPSLAAHPNIDEWLAIGADGTNEIMRLLIAKQLLSRPEYQI